MKKTPLLDIKNLTVTFETDEGSFKAVDSVSLRIDTGEIVGLVGESGCGKSVTALSILGLLPSPPARIQGTHILLKSNNILTLDHSGMRKIRGKRIGMIFQEPTAALSPLHKIGKQLVEALRFHADINKKEGWRIAEEWLKKVGIPDVEKKMVSYPHELSGGMQQRVMIAMVLMLDPELIIADEPTTALDVTIQAQIFQLIRNMRKRDTSILLITHDMGVVWEMCDRIMVMYASSIVETGSRDQIFNTPAHPYTQGLLRSIPKLSPGSEKLKVIPGSVPSPLDYPLGCRFRDRCIHAFDRCKEKMPPLVDVLTPGEGHQAACFIAETLIKSKDPSND